MKVLLAFADARGAVLTRDQLMLSCWNGAIVTDDAINRTVSEIRRIARSTGSGFGIETIPRVGYRLTGVAAEPTDTLAESREEAADAAVHRPSPTAPAQPVRRWLLGGALAAAGVGAIGLWRLRRPAPDPRFDAAMERGRQSMRQDAPGSAREAVGAFREALAINPNAEAWGLLALSLNYSANVSGSQDAEAATIESERAALRALALNPMEPNALITLALLQRRVDDWLTTETRMREVLAIDPGNIVALDYLVALLQSGGYTAESWDVNERAGEFDPLRPTPHFRRALKLWILGRGDEADQFAARTAELWPVHPFVRNARLLIATFTGRLGAARLLLDREAGPDGLFQAAGHAMWRSALTALESGTVQDVAAAREASLAAAPLSPALSGHAVMFLSGLGEVDAAYSVVEGFMLRRGLVVTRDRPDVSEYEADVGWRGTQWLFTPPAKALREDARFGPFAETIGLSRYWERRGQQPDERRTARA